VFDDYSSDGTVEIAGARGAAVAQHSFVNFAAQRNKALESVSEEWVFFVDADERVTPQLAAEIQRVVTYQGDKARAGWWVPRHNYMLGHRMRGGGWYPDHQLRLLRRDRARYDPGRPVHEVVMLEGREGYLENELIHYNYESVAQFRKKSRLYAEFEAGILLEQGVTTRSRTYISMPVREFWRRFVRLSGYRDHVYGLLFCGLMGWYTFVTYRRLGEMEAGQRVQ
jgi:glycosyltransferase involved in cell wall biosynthesis